MRTVPTSQRESAFAALGAVAASLLCGVPWAWLAVSLHLGRTTFSTVSAAWALAFAGTVTAVAFLAGLSWLALARKGSLSPCAAAVRVGVSSLPLALSAPLLVSAYGSDSFYHYLVSNSIPRSLVTWALPALAILVMESILLFSVPVPAALESWLRRKHATPVLLFAAFFVLYVFTSGGHLYSPDEREMYQVTESIANGTMPLTYDPARQAVDGPRRIYSKYGLVTSVLALPPYLVAEALNLDPDPPSAAFPIPNGAYPLVDLLVNPLVAALTVAVLYLMSRMLEFSRTASVLVASVYGITTSAWVYSKTLFSQPPATLFLLAATFFALRRGRNPARDFAVSGALLGLAAGSRVEVLFVALPLVACLVRSWRTDRGVAARSAVAFLLALAAGAGITAGWYDYMKTGSVFATGHGQQGTLAGFSPKPYIGLFGSLFSAGFGLVTYNPVVALGAVGFPLMAARRGFESRLFGAMIGIALLMYGSFGDWSGGFTWANRYLVVILPLAVLPVAVFLDRRWRSPLAVLLLSGVAAIGFGINLLAVLFDFNNGWLDLWDHHASLQQIQWDAHFSPIGAHVRLLSNFLATGAKLDLYLFYKLGLPALVVFGIVLSFLVAMLFRSALAEQPPLPARRAVEVVGYTGQTGTALTSTLSQREREIDRSSS